MLNMEQRPEQSTSSGMMYEPGTPDIADILHGGVHNVGEAGKTLVEPTKKVMRGATVAGLIASGVASAHAEGVNTVNDFSRLINDQQSIVHVGEYESLKNQEQSAEQLLTVPSALLTDQEKKNIEWTFPSVAKEQQFAGIFQGIQTDSKGGVPGLPFEKDSHADHLVQALGGLITQFNELGGQPDLVVGVDKTDGSMAAVIRINRAATVKDAQGNQKTYRAGTHMFIDENNTFFYLEPTGNPTWRVQLFRADAKFQADLARFLFNGKALQTATGAWHLDEVDEKNDAKVILLKGFSVNLYDSGDASSPKATPQPGTETELKTPVPDEVFMNVSNRIDNPESIAVGTFARIENDANGRHGIAANFGEGKTMTIVTDLKAINYTSSDVNKFMEDMVKIGFAPKFTGPIEIRILAAKPGEKPPSQVVATEKSQFSSEEVRFTVAYLEGNKTIYTVLVDPEALPRYEEYGKKRNRPDWAPFVIKNHFRFYILSELMANTPAIQTMRSDEGLMDMVYNALGKQDVTSITVDYIPERTPIA